LNRTVKWKNSIDETARFMDGGLIPSILIENKADLISEEELKNEVAVKEFAEKNNFIGNFRASAKTGLNINESMEYLITKIAERLDKCANSPQVQKQNDKKNVVLENSKYLARANKNKNGCC
jgi:50S ribosomal subunit-associated GTPase HflX